MLFMRRFLFERTHTFTRLGSYLNRKVLMINWIFCKLNWLVVMILHALIIIIVWYTIGMGVASSFISIANVLELNVYVSIDEI
jgi:hypothetical protein